jgi:hypothetical protein
VRKAQGEKVTVKSPFGKFEYQWLMWSIFWMWLMWSILHARDHYHIDHIKSIDHIKQFHIK